MREYPANDHQDHQDPPDAEVVAPDLQFIHRQLIAEGQLWQRRLPATQRLIERTERLTMSQALASAQTPQPTMQRLAPTGGREAPQSLPQSFVKGSRDMMTSRETNRAPSRMRSLWTGLAAIIVVALLAGVFYALAASRRSSGPASAPTATAQAHGKWQTIASLPFSEAPQGPVIAPSDPNTVYEATLSPLKLRRTTDQGAHWTDLHVPGDTSNLESFQVFVSPLDAKMVFVTLTSPLPPKSQASACPTILANQAPTGASTVGATRRTSGAAPLAGRSDAQRQYSMQFAVLQHGRRRLLEAAHPPTTRRARQSRPDARRAHCPTHERCLERAGESPVCGRWLRTAVLRAKR